MAAVTSFVVEENDLEPFREDGDTASVRIAFDAANGCERLEQRLIRFGPGRSTDRTLEGQEDLHVLSVLAPEDREAASGERKVTVRFADQPELDASSERTFRYLVNED